MKKEKQKILIIVHGLWLFKFKSKVMNEAKVQVTNFLTSTRGIKREDYHNLAKFLEKDYDKIIFFRWDGKYSHHNDEIARFGKLLKRYGDEKIDIIAGSLGGRIVSSALLEFPDININKVLFIGAVHDGHHKVKSVKKIINVYSKMDRLYFLANDIYEGIGNAFLRGVNVVNVALDKIRHDELFLNKPFEHKKYRAGLLYPFYRDLLREDEE